MHDTTVLKALAATLLLSGARSQTTCTNATATCPYGHWCPHDGVCPPNPCLTFPCGSHGRCQLDPHDGSTMTEHTPYCVCEAGFHCANDDCFVPMSCINDPCECQDCDQPGANCIQDGGGKCHCQVPPPPPPCPPEPCPGSHQHEDPDHPCTCICDAGYCGPECQTYDPACCDVSCSQHGHCIDSGSGVGHCDCDFADKSVDPATHFPAWYGAQCQLLDQCREKNCGSHGKCVDSDPDCELCMTAECVCNTCWSGDSCDVHNECCDFEGCNGHGEVVTDKHGNCSCQCDGCYTGDHCEIAPGKCVDLDTCKPTTHCGRCGLCNPNSGHCDCEQGWHPANGDDTCDAYDPCMSHNCGSHGKCEPGDDWISTSALLEAGQCTATATCNCDPGWTGDDCETDGCIGVVCGSHGRCAHTPEHPGTCECFDGWTGDECEMAPPHHDPCVEENLSCGTHGRCTKGTDGHAKCDCDLGWCGVHCMEQEVVSAPGSLFIPGFMSGGQKAGAGAVGLVVVGAIVAKRRMRFNASPLGEPIV